MTSGHPFTCLMVEFQVLAKYSHLGASSPGDWLVMSSGTLLCLEEIPGKKNLSLKGVGSSVSSVHFLVDAVLTC